MKCKKLIEKYSNLSESDSLVNTRSLRSNIETMEKNNVRFKEILSRDNALNKAEEKTMSQSLVNNEKKIKLISKFIKEYDKL